MIKSNLKTLPALALLLLATFATAAQSLYRPVDTIKYFVAGISFSPDGTLFSVIEQSDSNPDRKSTVSLYDAKSEKRVARFKLDKSTSWAAFSPDNHTLIVGDESVLRLSGEIKGSTVFTVDISNLNHINIKRRDDLEENHINAASFSPDGNCYAYGVDNGQVLVFNAHTNELVLKAVYPTSVTDVQFFSNDVIAVTAKEMKQLVLHRISTKEVLAKIPSPANYYVGTLRNGSLGNRFMFLSDSKGYLFDLKSIKPLDYLKAGMYPDRRPKYMDMMIAPNADFIVKIGEDKLTLYDKDLKEGGNIKFPPYPGEKRSYHRFWKFAIGNQTKVAFELNHIIYCGTYSDFLALSKK